jgi:hypothetical protein
MITFTFWLLLASILLPLAQADKHAVSDDLEFLDARDEWKPPHPGFTVESWVGGYYPQACERFAQEVKNQDTDLRPHCDLDQVEVFNITYNDCPDQSWVLCRCLDAELDMLGLAKGVGRLAPGLRAGISHAMAVSKKQINDTDDGVSDSSLLFYDTSFHNRREPPQSRSASHAGISLKTSHCF